MYKMIQTSRWNRQSFNQFHDQVTEHFHQKNQRIKTEESQKNRISLTSRFPITQNSQKSPKIPPKDIKQFLQKIQSERKSILKNITPLFNRSSFIFRSSPKNKEPKPTSHEQQFIRNNLRNTINLQTKRKSKKSNYNQKTIQQSFRKIIKQLKHRTFTRREDETQNKKYKAQSFGASIKGDKHNANQDSIIFSDNIFIICDGHGTNGKQISEFVSKTAHNLFQTMITENKIDCQLIRNILKKTEMQLDLSGIDIAFSGCTFLSIIISQNTIFSINVGDSKAILIRGIATTELCVLHKPDNVIQRQRIEQCGGIIHPIQIGKDKFSGPNRIWAPGRYSWGPGLALSRAFGDKASRKYGVISEPDIKTIPITYQSDFIVMGSDGLFDFMKDNEISFFVRKHLKEQISNREDIALNLAQQAKRLSINQSDDISCIIILL